MAAGQGTGIGSERCCATAKIAYEAIRFSDGRDQIRHGEAHG